MQEEKVSEAIAEVVKDDIWGTIQNFLDLGIRFGEGEKQIHFTIGIVLLVAVSFITTSFILKGIRKLYTRKMDVTDRLKFISVFKFIKYVVYIIVIISILSVSGVNITPILAASAAFLVGLGLALQEFFQDIIGGIFIMLDKSLMVGDVVEIDGKVGKVLEIKLRTTRAVTRDDKIIIIPNHKFIRDTIYNYTQNYPTTRESVTVGVAYGSDTKLVEQVLLQSVTVQKEVLKTPKPFVLFEDFGDSALTFSIYFFISDSFIDPRIKSDIRFRIDANFRKNDIKIPFPQRDIHIMSGSNNKISS